MCTHAQTWCVVLSGVPKHMTGFPYYYYHCDPGPCSHGVPQIIKFMTPVIYIVGNTHPENSPAKFYVVGIRHEEWWRSVQLRNSRHSFSNSINSYTHAQTSNTRPWDNGEAPHGHAHACHMESSSASTHTQFPGPDMEAMWWIADWSNRLRLCKEA